MVSRKFIRYPANCRDKARLVFTTNSTSNKAHSENTNTLIINNLQICRFIAIC